MALFGQHDRLSAGFASGGLRGCHGRMRKTVAGGVTIKAATVRATLDGATVGDIFHWVGHASATASVVTAGGNAEGSHFSKFCDSRCDPDGVFERGL
jgi:hypothetical protein